MELTQKENRTSNELQADDSDELQADDFDELQEDDSDELQADDSDELQADDSDKLQADDSDDDILVVQERKQKPLKLRLPSSRLNISDRFRQLNLDLFHFSSDDNHGSIMETGLFAWPYTPERAVHSGDLQSHKLDESKGLEQYVRLSFLMDHPAILSLICKGKLAPKKVRNYLIDLEVVDQEGVLFSDVTTIDKDALIKASIEHLNLDIIQLSASFGHDCTPNRYKRFAEAEVLVPKHILPQLIIGWERYNSDE